LDNTEKLKIAKIRYKVYKVRYSLSARKIITDPQEWIQPGEQTARKPKEENYEEHSSTE